MPQLHPETGEVIWDEGNNAQPIKDGRCCDACNWSVVVPVRLGAVINEDENVISKKG